MGLGLGLRSGRGLGVGLGVGSGLGLGARRVDGQPVLDLQVVVALVDHVEGGARRVAEGHRGKDDLGPVKGEPRVHRRRVEHQRQVRPLAPLLAATDEDGHCDGEERSLARREADRDLERLPDRERAARGREREGRGVRLRVRGRGGG